MCKFSLLLRQNNLFLKILHFVRFFILFISKKPYILDGLSKYYLLMERYR